MTNRLQHFGIMGAGAWGTALALTLRRARRDVTLWAHDPATAQALQNSGANPKYLPGVALDPEIRITANLADLASCDIRLIATPAQHVRALCRSMKETGAAPRPVILTAKGIEQATGTLLGDVIAEELPGHDIAVLSGPSFAGEVARGLPAALSLAARDPALGRALLDAIAGPAFRLYLTDDPIGAQIGGAIKNVLAVACGIVTGRGLGENARAALITRGLAEMTRLGIAAGGRAETLMGLSGLGDAVLTCASSQSRNTSLGHALGQGRALGDILAARAGVSEGVTTAAAALELARKHSVDMPIMAAVDAVLGGRATIDGTIASLLSRPLRSETR